MKRRTQPRKTPTVELGIRGVRVPIHSHIAYLWETEQDFVEALGFLEIGLLGADFCVVIGDRREHERILGLLQERGVDIAGFKVRKRLSFLKRRPTARKMLQQVAATFEAALAAGAPVVRLLGTVGWGESVTSDGELLSYEVHLTEIAERFPSVILCLHEAQSLSGLILRHGVLGTHPQTLEEAGILGNPYFIPLDRFLRRIGVLTADVAERQRVREELQRSNDQLRALSARLRAVREEESVRIAREVHDELGQSLTALGMDLAWLEKKLSICPPAIREALAGRLRSMGKLLETAGEAVQQIVSELRPGILDELGLEAAVEWYVAEFQQRTGISCRLQADLGEAGLDADRATALFRILQEALTNVARHAEAAEVRIRLAAGGGRIVLTVTDDGRGIPEDKLADSRSLGLLGMRERARALGGDVVVLRHPAGGTTVAASLPP
jgi:signal transduction histidine kinase